jgi:hypothetical protein
MPKTFNLIINKSKRAYQMTQVRLLNNWRTGLPVATAGVAVKPRKRNAVTKQWT